MTAPAREEIALRHGLAAELHPGRRRSVPPLRPPGGTLRPTGRITVPPPAERRRRAVARSRARTPDPDTTTEDP